MAINFFQKDPSGLASRGDKVRGLIAIGLAIASWTLAYNTTDQQWLFTFMLAGFFYFLTALGIVFKEV